jgi:hypothetical protein
MISNIPDVLRLAATGARIPQIAAALGLDEEDAADLLLAAVQKAAQQALDRDGAREVELAHLDLLRQSLTPQALRGDLTAARLLVRVSAQKALLLGLVPAGELDGYGSVGTSELDRIRARREERRAASSTPRTER